MPQLLKTSFPSHNQECFLRWDQFSLLKHFRFEIFEDIYNLQLESLHYRNGVISGKSRHCFQHNVRPFIQCCFQDFGSKCNQRWEMVEWWTNLGHSKKTSKNISDGRINICSSRIKYRPVCFGLVLKLPLKTLIRPTTFHLMDRSHMMNESTK